MIQKATATGSGHVIVQIQGDGNSVIAGLPHLVLSRQAGLARRIHMDRESGKASEIDVLRASTRAIPRVGRDREMSDLREWLDSVSPISIRVMTGAAGHGKSRLAIELIDEVAPCGWHSGFLTRAEMKRFYRQYNISDWGWHRPVLVVVDYAAASAGDLNAWLMELATSSVWEDAGSGRIPPLRVLLLERHAQPGCGWWVEAFGIGRDADVLERMLDPPIPYELGPIVRPRSTASDSDEDAGVSG